MRGSDKVAVLHYKVVNRHDGQVQLERLPVRAIIERDVYARLGSRVEQAAPRGVFADRTGEVVLGDASGDFRPARAVIVCLIQVGLEVVPLVAGGREVSDGGIMGRRLDDAD